MIDMRSMLYISCVSTLVGCMSLDSGPQTDSSSQSVVVNNRLASNRLASNRLASNRLASNRLALGSSANDLINSADGREVLTYIIGCAVPEGTTVVGTDSTGLDYEFFGELGLAPHWIDHELDHNGMGWVSACLFARVNAFDVAVPISMRGPSRALLASADEISSWTLEEGAFYGNYFAPADRPIEWFACRGHDDTTAEDRVCTQPDPANPGKTLCGFNDAGTCYAAHHHSHAACIGFDQHDGGFYVDCPIDEHHGWVFERDGHDHDDGDDHGDGHGETVVHQVITTYVHP
jgi:hypothetical protein